MTQSLKGHVKYVFIFWNNLLIELGVELSKEK